MQLVIDARTSVHRVEDDDPPTPRDDVHEVRRRVRKRCYTAGMKACMVMVALSYIYVERENWLRHGDYYYQLSDSFDRNTHCTERFPLNGDSPDYFKFAMTIISLYILNTAIDWIESMYIFFHPQTYMVHRVGLTPRVSSTDPVTTLVQSSMGFVNYFSSFASLSVITGTRIVCGIRTINISESRSMAMGLLALYAVFMGVKYVFHRYPGKSRWLLSVLVSMIGMTMYITFSGDYDMYRDGLLRLPDWTFEGFVFTGNLTIMFSEVFFAFIN